MANNKQRTYNAYTIWCICLNNSELLIELKSRDVAQ